MSLDHFLKLGIAVPIGSHRFDPDAIKAFARKWDPQPFHLDEEAAGRSVFGRLCASGWHTAAVWMRLNVEAGSGGAAWRGTGPPPEFGPSPGFRNLKWPKPVYAGEAVAYSRTALAHRPLSSRPGWRLLSVRADGVDSAGDRVIEFESAVLLKVS
jgi:acyl dehydratase